MVSVRHLTITGGRPVLYIYRQIVSALCPSPSDTGSSVGKHQWRNYDVATCHAVVCGKSPCCRCGVCNDLDYHCVPYDFIHIC